jgi:hypothetical protein
LDQLADEGADEAAKRHLIPNRADEFHSTAQARAWADGDFDADHGLGLDGVGRSAHWSRVRGIGGAGEFFLKQ